MSPSLRASVRRILFAASAMAATAAIADPQQSQSSSTQGSTEIAEIVIVTGSYIKGTAEDAALPVDVLTTEDLQKQGSPSMTDLIKSIPAVQGVIGESNQFGVANGTGTSNVNLRGLGATRTLVLLNGRRLAGSPTGTGVDTNLLPSAAIGRIEVLKDGAAATYGSDAIGGVVNFITKDNARGLSLDGSYSYIPDSDGDYEAHASYGWQVGRSSGLIAAGYRHRSELSTLDRDWAIRPFAESAEGGWSGFSNPGTFSVSAAAAAANGITAANFDPACTALGGTVSAGCRFQYTAYDNLVEDEDHYQVFADYNLDVTDSVTFHAEALYAAHDVPHEQWSPSYGPNQGPAGGAPTYFVPLASPGLQALLPFLTPQQVAAVNASVIGGAPGVTVSGLSWRPLAQGGNPATGGPQEASRKFDSFRLSAGFKGEFGGGISWDTAVTYMEDGSDIATPDFLPARIDQALRGLGGPNCTGTTPGANGCLWLNPFSTGIPSNPATGQQNSLTFNPNAAIDPNLVRWLTTPNSYEATTSLLVADAVLSGEMGGFTLPGGNIGWAFGIQYRDDGFKRDVTDDFANGALYPCAARVVNPAAVCASANGALSFYGPLLETDVSRDMYAVFGELSLPITDTIQAQLAVRYEDYGSGVGDTTNPKLSVRWQATDWLALRGSVGTTFRAPTPVALDPASNTTLFFTPQAGGYKPVDTFGNPSLQPETADTFNVGFIFNAGPFGATVDYFNFKFEDALTAEVGTQLITALYSPYVDAGGVARTNHCADTDPRYVALRGRFTFSGACDSGIAAAPAFNLLRTTANNINAQGTTEISGIDASMHYGFENVLGGDLTVGFDGTYNIEYKLSDNFVEGILIDPAQDAIGTRGGRGGTLPQWKGSLYLDLGTGIHNIRWTTRYVDGLEDVRVATFATNANGKNIDSFITHDLTYRVDLPAQTTLSASVFNVLDEDPSFARLDLNYDPFVGNPLGRYFKVAVAKKF